MWMWQVERMLYSGKGQKMASQGDDEPLAFVIGGGA